MSRAAGATIKALTRNLSLSRQPCVCVAIMVVSEINDRLSPKKEPPTIIAVIIAISVPVCWATPTAIGTKAAIVPTLVPIAMDTKQAARNMPASSICGGRRKRVRLTVASILPIVLAEQAKEPARIKIQIISIICSVAAPRL